MSGWTNFICRECNKAYSLLLPKCTCCDSGSVKLVKCTECGSEGVEEVAWEAMQEFLREVHAA